MISTADGAASLVDHSRALGGPADKAMCELLRSLADVVLVGAGTVRDNHYGACHLDEAARARRRNSGLSPVPPIAVVTRACQLDWDSSFFTDVEQRPIVVTVQSAAAADRADAAAVADVVVSGDENVDFAAALSALAARGLTDVLAEGGPGLAVQLANAALLDDICLTMAPMLAAGDGSRILADGPPLQPPATLELRHVLESDGYLFIRYSVVR
jgi:riboflavin biosynthesis pyrimidine reductase